MSAITTHVLDLSRGEPAAGVGVRLERARGDEGWERLATGTTDARGRLVDLLNDDADLEAGTYRLRFDIDAYFRGLGQACFYPYAEVVFRIDDPVQHYHVPLLLSPFGYSTYRGS